MTNKSEGYFDLYDLFPNYSQGDSMSNQCSGSYQLRQYPDFTEQMILEQYTKQNERKNEIKNEIKNGSRTIEDPSYIIGTEDSLEPQESKNIEVIQNKKITKALKLYPGETKNLAKNLIRAKQLFIQQIFTAQDIKANKTLKTFLNLSPKLASKFKLDEFLGTRIGWEIGRHFFGQYMWSSIFVQENKTELEQYIRLNSLWIKPKPKMS